MTLVTGADFTTIHDQPAPKGSPDDERTTSTTAASTTTSVGATTESTATSSTTTTTVIGYKTGEPPDGVECG